MLGSLGAELPETVKILVIFGFDDAHAVVMRKTEREEEKREGEIQQVSSKPLINAAMVNKLYFRIDKYTLICVKVY